MSEREEREMRKNKANKQASENKSEKRSGKKRARGEMMLVLVMPRKERSVRREEMAVSQKSS